MFELDNESNKAFKPHALFDFRILTYYTDLADKQYSTVTFSLHVMNVTLIVVNGYCVYLKYYAYYALGEQGIFLRNRNQTFENIKYSKLL